MKLIIYIIIIVNVTALRCYTLYIYIFTNQKSEAQMTYT